MPFSTQRTSPSPTSRLGGGGLDYITSSTFSSAASVSVDGCFTNAYTDYLVNCDFVSNTGNLQLLCRLRAAGADDSSANYKYGLGGGNGGGTGTDLGADNSTSFAITGTMTPQSHSFSLTFLSPQLASKTRFVGTSQWLATSGYCTSSAISAMLNTTSQFDGFTIYTSSNTITGTITVYGYRKA